MELALEVIASALLVPRWSSTIPGRTGAIRRWAGALLSGASAIPRWAGAPLRGASVMPRWVSTLLRVFGGPISYRLPDSPGCLSEVSNGLTRSDGLRQYQRHSTPLRTGRQLQKTLQVRKLLDLRIQHRRFDVEVLGTAHRGEYLQTLAG